MKHAACCTSACLLLLVSAAAEVSVFDLEAKIGRTSFLETRVTTQLPVLAAKITWKGAAETM